MKTKPKNNEYIIDRYGYVVGKAISFGTSPSDEFMAGHDYVTDEIGAEYYFCNGYNTEEIENDDVSKHNCSIAMEHNMKCQCGKH